jgi:transcriptional regulator NrdR family protein
VSYYRCENCHGEFRTQESYAATGRNWLVQRKNPTHDGGREPYDLGQIYSSLTKATLKVDSKTLWTVAKRAERLLSDKEVFPPETTSNTTSVYSTNQIAHAVMLALLDSGLVTAWIRYALVFYNKEAERDFNGLMNFLTEKQFEDQKKLIALRDSAGEQSIRDAVGSKRFSHS